MPRMPIRLTTSALALLGALAIAVPAFAAEDWQHATALSGEPKYPADFPHFDYVNPDAPKGGEARLSSTGTFDNLNFVPRRGDLADGLGLIYDTLMTSALDEVSISAEYGLIAEAVRFPDDFSSVTYRLREEARWHDGEPITPEDVVWSFEVLTEHNPGQAFYYRHVETAEVSGPNEVTFTFDEAGNRELPKIVGQLIVLPKHYWTAEGRDVTASTLDAPLGSGAYRVARVVPGRTITYERVEDYWAADLPVNVGSNNFDTIRYEYFRDADVAREAFKADAYDWYDELSANRWATQWDIPQIEKGVIKKFEFEDVGSGRMQGYVFNLRNPKFQDPRVRRAIHLAYDFESANKRISFGLNERIRSYFAGTELASDGLPEGEELEILETVRTEVGGEGIPDSVFTTPYEPSVGGDSRAVRANLREASQLLEEAGYVIRDGVRVNAETGEPLTVEFLLQSAGGAARGPLAYKQDLDRLGIDVSIRQVDTAQYIRRAQDRDFEMAIFVWGQSLSPGNEQNEYWGSEAADRSASRNYGGIKNPAIDALIQRIVFADDRDTLVAATKAMDRVLLHNEYVVPQFRSPVDRILHWDRFDHPEPLPAYTPGFPTIWWYDEEAAALTEAAK